MWTHRRRRGSNSGVSSRSQSSRANLWNASGFLTATAAAAAGVRGRTERGGHYREEEEDEKGGGDVFCDNIYGGALDATGDRYLREGNEDLEFSRLKMTLLKSRRQEVGMGDSGEMAGG